MEPIDGCLRGTGTDRTLPLFLSDRPQYLRLCAHHAPVLRVPVWVGIMLGVWSALELWQVPQNPLDKK